MSALPITLDLQPRIDAALSLLRGGHGAQCLSDFAFSNLYLFRAAHDYRFLPGEWPCISGRAYDGTRHLMPLFDLVAAPVAGLPAMLDGHDGFYPVAGATTTRLDPRYFALSQLLDDADYLYSAAIFADYPGRALAKKRNLVRQFLAAHAPTS